jgi:hypothetical protein
MKNENCVDYNDTPPFNNKTHHLQNTGMKKPDFYCGLFGLPELDTDFDCRLFCLPNLDALIFAFEVHSRQGATINTLIKSIG